MAKTFKTASLAGYGALGDNADTLRAFVLQSPELLQQIGGEQALENYIAEHQAALMGGYGGEGGFNGLSADTQRIDNLLSGYNMDSIGYAGMEDGRQKAITQNGQTLFTGDPYSYQPAKENLQTALTGAALIGGTAGLSALTGGIGAGSNALQGIAAMPGDFGAVSGGLGGSFSGLTGALGGGMDLGSILGSVSGGDWLRLGGNLLSGFMGDRASGKASDALVAAGRESNALQKYIFDTIRADNQPLLDLRNQTLPQINALMADPSSITSDPGYQFGLDQGMKSLDQSAASRGMLYSGAQMKGAQQFGQDYAGTKLTDSLNRLMGVAGLGQVGASSNAQAGQNYGTNVGNTLQGMGNARASGYVGSANSWNNALGNIFNDQQWNQVWGRP